MMHGRPNDVSCTYTREEDGDRRYVHKLDQKFPEKRNTNVETARWPIDF